MSNTKPSVSFKPFQVKIFDKDGRSVYTDTCSFKPDLKYVQQLLPLIFVRLVRKGKKDVKDYTVAIIESTVTVLGSVNDVLGKKVED